MHRERTGMHRNSQEHIGEHGGAARERNIMYDKGHHELPINAQTSTHLTSAVVVSADLFLLLLRRFFE